jgi:type IV pilus assembly protein PilX
VHLDRSESILLTKPARAPATARQEGIVLFIALIVLVVMTLAAIALVRSVDTTNLIAGNLTFQQSATHSGDSGVETAIAWLNTSSAATLRGNVDGYVADGNTLANNPASGQSWDSFWNQSLASRPPFTLNPDAAGNVVSYVIDRLCDSTGDSKDVLCATSPNIGKSSGAEEAGQKMLAGNSAVYYRITARIAGPKNTLSYVQVIYAL